MIYDDANQEDFFDYVTEEQFIRDMILDGSIHILELPFSIRTSSHLYYVMAFRRARRKDDRKEACQKLCDSLARDTRILPDGSKKMHFQQMLDGYLAMLKEW